MAWHSTNPCYCRWNYVDLIVYLRNRERTDMTGLESCAARAALRARRSSLLSVGRYVINLIDESDTTFFPMHKVGARPDNKNRAKSGCLD